MEGVTLTKRTCFGSLQLPLKQLFVELFDQDLFSCGLLFQISAPVLDTSDMDPELARYLNRNYWEQKQDTAGGSTGPVESMSTTQPSAPVATAEGKMSTGSAVKVSEVTELPQCERFQEKSSPVRD